MNELEVFSNNEFGDVRTVMIDGKPYFVATDIAKALGYKRPSDAISAHCRYTAKYSIPHPQSETKTIEVNVIPEGDMYRLISHSELPSSEKFESWIFDEVLPSIRKTGTYSVEQSTPNVPITYRDAVAQLLESLDREEELKAQLDTSKDWYSIKRVAALNGVSWKRFDWRKLKATGITMGYEVKKIFDANYGEVNTYHKSVWEKAYPQYEL